jgi:hypothetical protein
VYDDAQTYLATESIWISKYEGWLKEGCTCGMAAISRTVVVGWCEFVLYTVKRSHVVRRSVNWLAVIGVWKEVTALIFCVAETIISVT